MVGFMGFLFTILAQNIVLYYTYRIYMYNLHNRTPICMYFYIYDVHTYRQSPGRKREEKTYVTIFTPPVTNSSSTSLYKTLSLVSLLHELNFYSAIMMHVHTSHPHADRERSKPIHLSVLHQIPSLFLIFLSVSLPITSTMGRTKCVTTHCTCSRML